MTRHDRTRYERARDCDRTNIEEVRDALRGLQSTDDPSLLPLHDELQEVLRALEDPSEFPRVAGAYGTDQIFRLLVNEWVDQRRCPPPLIDRCLDLDLPRAAACARWASDPVVTPDQLVRDPMTGLGERGGYCGPYPSRDFTDTEDWYWVLYPGRPSAPHYVPDRFIRPGNALAAQRTHSEPTPLDAILWLLGNWSGNSENRP